MITIPFNTRPFLRLTSPPWTRDGFVRRVLPPLVISDDELDRSVCTDLPVRIVDRDPDTIHNRSRAPLDDHDPGRTGHRAPAVHVR